MPVDLLPPVSSSPFSIPGRRPATTAPRYVRTAGMSRWHRVRSGVHYETRTAWHLWCGQQTTTADAVGRDEPPVDGLPVCGSCEGRALGAGQDDNPGPVDLVFEPRWLTPPSLCPGARYGLFEDLRNRVGRCLACGEMYPLRAAGGPYNPRTAITRHKPGPGLVAPCPFHAWNHMALVDGQAGCGPCSRDGLL